MKHGKNCPESLLVADCDCDGNRHSTAIDIHVHKRCNVGGAMMTLNGCTKSVFSYSPEVIPGSVHG